MKYIILMLFMTSTLYAQRTVKVQTISIIKEDVNTPTPEELEGATITITTKDGVIHRMKANKFKVVPRKQQLKVKEIIVTQNNVCQDIKPAVITNTVIKKIVRPTKNLVSLTFNRSLDSYTYEVKGASTYVENRYSPAIGLMYQRNIYRNIYLGIMVDSHEAIGGSLGVSF